MALAAPTTGTAMRPPTTPRADTPTRAAIMVAGGDRERTGDVAAHDAIGEVGRPPCLLAAVRRDEVVDADHETLTVEQQSDGDQDGDRARHKAIDQQPAGTCDAAAVVLQPVREVL